MAIELFWASGSGFSWRVQLALELKQIAYQSHLLQFSQQDHKRPDYLAINPRGQVPSLRDGDVVVAESIAILAYLERKFPQTPLFGTTPAESGAIWQQVMETVCYLDAPTEAFILPIYFGRIEARTPEIQAAVPALHAEFSRMEARLAQRPWLAGPILTAADVAAYPQIKSVARAAGKPAAASIDADVAGLRGDKYPGLHAWMARIEALPIYDRTYPPHWR